MSVTVEGIVNKTAGGTVSMTVENLVNKTAGVMTNKTMGGTTGIDMTTVETLTIINKSMTNRIRCQNEKERGWTRRYL